MEVGTVQRVDIKDTMQSAYISYAMSVISSRALPDVRDGLKPVQRRILYAMYDMGLRHDHPTRKSARIVGEVLGKYHPHGDSAVYDAMVRMAQEFSMRYVLVEGQGNFGSIDGDEAAAMRYTEAHLAAIGEELLLDLEKDTVDFVDNFDGSLQEPAVLPAKLPNLLINGAAGIAVGMATRIPPHNLGEIAEAVAYLIDHYDAVDEVTVDDLMERVEGPDFPTGGIILGREGIRKAYATGKGRVVVRAKIHVEELSGGRSALVVTELPYQVNKSNLVERIADLVRDERIQGISDLRDESDRTGMRIVIVLKRGVETAPILDELYKHTQLRDTFGVNMLALVDGEPRTLSLKRALIHYIEHRREVLARRTRYELARAEERAHILEGLQIALDNLDEVIETIRRSRRVDTARRNLCRNFGLSEVQAQAILDMQLRRLASVERRRIQEEYEDLCKRIDYLQRLLEGDEGILDLIRSDALALKKAYADARRTHISDDGESAELQPERLLPDNEVLILLTRDGMIRRMPGNMAYSKRRNVPGMTARESDALQSFCVVNSQASMVFFTNKGQAFSLPAHRIPDTAQEKRGLPVSHFVHLEDDEQIVAMIPIEDLSQDAYIGMATRQGQIKRLAFEELETLGRRSAEVIGLAEGDELGWVTVCDDKDEFMIVTREGKAIRFKAEEVRPQGRSAQGVKGVTLKGEGNGVVGMDVVRKDAQLLVVTTRGYAKRTPIQEYSVQGRGGQGMLTVDWNRNAETGPVAAAKIVYPEEQVVFVTKEYEMERVAVEEIPELGRATWGWLVTKENALVETEKDPVVRIVRLRREDEGLGEDDEGTEPAEDFEEEGEEDEESQEEAEPEEENEEEDSRAAGKARGRRTRRSAVTRTPQRRRSG
ncbi:MAG: DNA gyrase subunit A [Chloroflexota bacterium]|nr:DNA gyrase subunit A [Chloroflexota bacterium]